MRQWGLLACTVFAALALGALGGRWVTRVGLAVVGAWVGIAASAFLQQEFWFVAWATVATYVSYFLGDISRLSGAGRLGMIAFFVGTACVCACQPALLTNTTAGCAQSISDKCLDLIVALAANATSKYTRKQCWSSSYKYVNVMHDRSSGAP